MVRTEFELKVNQQVSLFARADTKFELEQEKGLDDLGSVFFNIHRVTDHSDSFIGHTFFSAMPGCCGIVVSHGTYLTEYTRHTGLSQPFRDLKELIAKKLGYSAMIATTQLDNIPAVGNMLKSKYNIRHTFTNSRTGNLLGVGFKVLK